MTSTICHSEKRHKEAVEISLRWGDTDANGHVNNCAIVRLLEEARIRWLRRTGHFEMRESTAVVASHHIEYRRQIKYAESPVIVHMQLGSIKRSSFELIATIEINRTLAVRGVTRLVSFDFSSESPIPLPEDFKAHLENLQSHTHEMAEPS